MWEIGKRAPVFEQLGLGRPENHEPQILTHVIEHFHHLGGDRTVPSNVPVVLPGAQGFGRERWDLGGWEWVTLTIMNSQTLVIDHFSIQEG